MPENPDNFVPPKIPQFAALELGKDSELTFGQKVSLCLRHWKTRCCIVSLLVTAVAVGLAILAIHLHSTRHSEIEAIREDPTCDANAKVLAPVPLYIVEFGVAAPNLQAKLVDKL